MPATTAAAAAAAPPSSSSTTTTAKAVPAVASQRRSKPKPEPIQRFSQYGARFKAKPKTGSGPAAPARSPSGLSSRGFFSLGGGSAAGAAGARGTSSSSGGVGAAFNGNGREAGGARHGRREREPDPKTTPSPQRVSPRQLPLVGPAALAATINSTLTVTTGRAAGETISTFDSSSNTNGSSGGGGGGGSAFAVGGGSGGAESTSPAYSETWAWENPETPPASMPNLHQSSGSEDPSGSEDDEGFGLGYLVDSDYENFVLQRRSASTSALKFRSALASAPGGGSLGVTGSSASRLPSAKGAEGVGVGPAPPPPSQSQSQNQSQNQSQPLPPRFPRSMSVGHETGAAVVQPSTAPPPLPARRLVGGAQASVAAPARSPPRRRPVSMKPARTKTAAAPKGKEDDELRAFFRDPRLETTLVRRTNEII